METLLLVWVGNYCVLFVEIPSDFEQKIQKEGISEVLISANTVNGTNGSIGSSYISEIIQNFRNELIEEKFPSKSPTGLTNCPQELIHK